MRALIEEMGTYIQGALKSGVFENGAGLHPSSQRVRLVFKAGQRTLTRGSLQEVDVRVVADQG